MLCGCVLLKRTLPPPSLSDPRESHVRVRREHSRRQGRRDLARAELLPPGRVRVVCTVVCRSCAWVSWEKRSPSKSRALLSCASRGVDLACEPCCAEKTNKSFVIQINPLPVSPVRVLLPAQWCTVAQGSSDEEESTGPDMINDIDESEGSEWEEDVKEAQCVWRWLMWR